VCDWKNCSLRATLHVGEWLNYTPTFGFGPDNKMCDVSCTTERRDRVVEHSSFVSGTSPIRIFGSRPTNGTGGFPQSICNNSSVKWTTVPT
jgi:hypothetical protein